MKEKHFYLLVGIFLYIYNIILKEIIDSIGSQEDKLLEDGKQINNILYLPNGNGKIYVTTMIMKRMGSSLNKYVQKYLLKF